MLRLRAHLLRLERLLGSAGIAALTAWLMGAQAAVPPVHVQVTAPAPVVVSAPRPAPGRCVANVGARQALPRDPFAARVVVPVVARGGAPEVEAAGEAAVVDETPAQPLPAREVTVLGEALSTAGLGRAQVELLETIAKLPDMPTESVHGARYVRFGASLYRDDCSNVLRIPYAAQGIDLFSEYPKFPDANGVSLIEHKGARVVTPEVGDLVLFDDTWDRNRNGARDDENTHAAIVVGFEAGGTVLLYNRVRSGHRLHRMNLGRPDVHRDPKTKARLNDFLRRRRKGEPKGTLHLTGELFAGYVRVLR